LQDSADCFDPLKKIGYYFSSEKIDEKYFAELLDYFLLPKVESINNYFPHELSIGMAQRLAIIWGLLSKPKLLLLDEPNSALDISISNLLSNKLKEVAEEQKMAVLFISQDIDFAVNTASKIGLLTNTGLIEFEKGDFEKLSDVYLNKNIRINHNE
jgi:ABC-type dipeptide/oligopeptide/nickel transport system ATPase component